MTNTLTVDNRNHPLMAERERYLEQRIEVLQEALKQVTRERDMARTAFKHAVDSGFRVKPSGVATCINEQLL